MIHAIVVRNDEEPIPIVVRLRDLALREDSRKKKAEEWKLILNRKPSLRSKAPLLQARAIIW
jgi:hypothetical protein